MKQLNPPYYFLLLCFSISLTGCSKKIIYDVRSGDYRKCAGGYEELSLVVRNESELGFTNLQIETVDGPYNLGYIRPWETTCALSIPPFKIDPELDIFILWSAKERYRLKGKGDVTEANQVLKKGAYQLTIHCVGDRKNPVLKDYKVEVLD